LLDVAEAAATVVFGVAGSVCSLYGLVLPVTRAKDLEVVEERLCLWGAPRTRLLTRALGYHSARTVLWVARAVSADIVSTATLAVIETLIGGRPDVGSTVPIVALSAGVISTAVFAPLFMQLDRCTVLDRFPTTTGLTSSLASPDEPELPEYAAGVVQDVVVLTLLHDTAQAMLPSVAAMFFGDSFVATISGWMMGVVLLKPISAVSSMCTVSNVRATEGWSLLQTDEVDKEDTRLLASISPVWRSVPAELAVTAAAGGIHIALLITLPLIGSVFR
jgi:hypothetical protein